MHPPSELMTKHLLPALRGLLAHTLRERGCSQSRIAGILGVTQASISLYLARKPSFYRGRLMELGVPETDTDRYVEMLTEDAVRGRVEAIYTLSSIWRNLLASGLLCPTHRRESSILEDCDVCMRLYGAAETDVQKAEVLHHVERAAKTLEDSQVFHRVMPAVSVNLVMALSSAETEADVAAFPGRIVNVRGRAKPVSPAEFGVSRHMARMLLAVMRRNPQFRAAINIKYDGKVQGILSDLGLAFIRISGDDHRVSLEGDVVVSAFKAKLNTAGPSIPIVVVDEGGEGLEPITYIFGRDAAEAAQRALEIAEQYVER